MPLSLYFLLQNKNPQGSKEWERKQQQMIDANTILVAWKHMENLADQRELKHEIMSCVKEKLCQQEPSQITYWKEV